MADQPKIIAMDGFGKVAIATEGYAVKGGINAAPRTPRPPPPKPSITAQNSATYGKPKP